MKLPRVSGRPNFVSVEARQDNVPRHSVVRVAVGVSENPGDYGAARLNEQEVSDLITMLQYYKLQVWPDGA